MRACVCGVSVAARGQIVRVCVCVDRASTERCGDKRGAWCPTRMTLCARAGGNGRRPQRRRRVNA